MAWLLIFGKLPNREELAMFRDKLTATAYLHEGMKHHFEGFPVDAPPMAILSAMINTLSCFDAHFGKIEDDEAILDAAARLMSKVRTIAAYSYRRSLGLPFMYPIPDRCATAPTSCT